MSKFDEAMDKYRASLGGMSLMGGHDDTKLVKVAKSLGPSIYLADASLVSCSEQSELDRVKANFLIKKHGLTDGPDLDAAIKAVCAQMGSSNKSKHRAVFYYLLAEKVGKLDSYV